MYVAQDLATIERLPAANRPKLVPGMANASNLDG